MAKRKLLIRRLTIHHNIEQRVAKDCKMCVRIFAEIGGGGEGGIKCVCMCEGGWLVCKWLAF